MYTAVQFPGLGGYAPGVLKSISADSAVSGMLREVDQAAREYGVPPVSVLLNDPEGPGIEELARTPTRLHLACMATGLALYGQLVARDRPGDVLVGHSTGELTALAAAGSLSVYDAARVVCEREVALAEGSYKGGLTALRISAGRAGHLCAAVGWTLQPSLFNAPLQTVVSGNAEELPRLEKAARALGIQATRLLVGYPHHHPMLAGAADQVAAATATYRLKAPRIPVWSPLLGHLVRDVDAVRGIVDRHLTDSVHYLAAVRELHAEFGIGTFLEAGPRALLTECAAESLPPGVELLGPPPGVTDARRIVDALLLSGKEPSRPAASVPEAQVRAPEPSRPVPAPAPDPTSHLAPARAEERTPAPADAPEARPSSSASSPSALPERDQLLSELRKVFASVLGYPEEVFTADAHLEADLGISSVKKTELLVRILDRYSLPTPPADLRIREYNTLPKLADLLLLLADGEKSKATSEGAAA
ncbi:acyltransferase domain-containing protein [Streptomyces sp. NPDC058653]|uniref:acyltransferase domain-containing protein n=1 Tax=Streptomyces sp. NPDC058653 TaxID=3346576 RepID=UPI0036664A0A